LSQLPIIAGSFLVGAGGMFAYLHPQLAATVVTREIPNAIASVIPQPHTVSWYVAHQDAMKGKLSACQEDPGSAIRDPECENASEAFDKVTLDRFIEGAPRR
jgi:hypothetical protein